jgi:hypothetical protein
LFGALAGAGGSALSDRLSSAGRTVPTGPTIVLCATAIVVLSFAWRAVSQRVRVTGAAAAIADARPGS